MSVRTTLPLFVVAVIGAGFAASTTRTAVRIPACREVRVGGGDYNGMTGGVLVAQVLVTNVGRRTCAVLGRPWIRLPRIPHPVTVADLPPGTASGRVVLSPGERASAQVLLVPGGCDRGQGVVFHLTARAGWSKRGVRIGGSMCDDGSGQILVSAFSR